MKNKKGENEMGINIDAIKAKLANLKSQTDKQDNLWKPKPGKTQIRMVPYRFNQENPFIELYFHYDLGGKNYLSPKTFGRPDPILELAEKLKMSGDKEEFKLARKLEPKMRTYVPIIVRGELDANGELKPGTGNNAVKFWGFGKTVYQDIMSYIADADYGDISDVETGRDIVVEFKTAEETGRNFPETKIRPKPNKSVLTDDSDELAKMITTQKNIAELYKEYSYDELKDILTKWLNDDDDDESESDESANTSSQKSTNSSQESPTKVAESTVVTDKSEIKSQFDDLFNESK